MAIENENDAYLTKFPGIGKKRTSNCARFKRQKFKLQEKQLRHF